VTSFGRVIQFPGPINDETFRNATAAEPQSTAADYLNRAIVKTYYEGPEEFEFLLQVYDSILFQIPDDLDCLIRNIQAMKTLTEIEIDIHGIPLVIPTDFEFGYSWGELKEIKSTSRSDISKVYDTIRNTE
jgi:DNA polymerase I-like protein with 3'-5' exonuclease and polymerase domains